MNYNESIYNLISKCVCSDAILVNEPMSKHTSFKIGGNADFLVQPNSKIEISKLISCCKENNLPYIVIGNGSNLLVSDNGIKGIVIKVGKQFSNITLYDEETIFAESGATLAGVAAFALKNKLSGFEFASGIPGTVGGALIMNAGAYGGEIKDIAIAGEVIDADGQFMRIDGDDQNFGYRTSAYDKNGSIVVGAWFKLQKCDDTSMISDKMKELNQRRKDKQPLEFGSAGSTFKRPEGHFAGKLIEDCGLKGYTIGGAQVSEKHAGFVINIGNATCKDVIDLMKYVRDRVYADSGIMLEPEVKIIGVGVSL